MLPLNTTAGKNVLPRLLLRLLQRLPQMVLKKQGTDMQLQRLLQRLLQWLSTDMDMDTNQQLKGLITSMVFRKWADTTDTWENVKLKMIGLDTATVMRK